jgi:lysozyme family protein
MQNDFTGALAFVLQAEGGYSDDQDDPGGATCKGIEQGEYDVWRRRSGLPLRSVAFITDDEAGAIYKAYYWVPIHGDYVASRTAYTLFDTGVNCGVGTALEFMQGVLGIPVTRVFDTMTSMGYHNWFAVGHSDAEMAAGILARREAHYHALVAENPKLKKFLPGWLGRVNRLSLVIANL